MSWDGISSSAGIVSLIVALGAMIAVTRLTSRLRTEAVTATATAMTSWVAEYNSMLLELTRDADLARLFRHGLDDFDQLDRNDQLRFHTWMVAHLLNAQNVFLQVSEDTMDSRVADQILPFSAAMLNSTGGRSWWQSARPIMRPEFVAYMDDLIEESGPVADIWPWFSTDEQEEDAAPDAEDDHAEKIASA